MALYQKYRPTTWAEVIGQPKAVATIRRLIERPGFGADCGEAIWISGPTGSGKTTIAQVAARALGVTPGGAWNYTEIDGDKCSVDTVRDLDTSTRAAGLWADTWRVWIVNESHALQGRAILAWHSLLERFPRRWLLVCTTSAPVSRDLFGAETDPFLSRFHVVELTNQGLAQAFAKRAREIADAEGMNGRPAEAYLKLVQSCHNNMRAVLQSIEDGAMMVADYD